MSATVDRPPMSSYQQAIATALTLSEICGILLQVPRSIMISLITSASETGQHQILVMIKVTDSDSTPLLMANSSRSITALIWQTAFVEFVESHEQIDGFRSWTRTISHSI